jgi:hypothetical protein
LFGAVDGDEDMGRAYTQSGQSMVPQPPVNPRMSGDNSVSSDGRQTTPSRVMQSQSSPSSARNGVDVRSPSPQSLKNTLLNPAILRIFYERFRALIFPVNTRGDAGNVSVSSAHASLAKRVIERYAAID